MIDPIILRALIVRATNELYPGSGLVKERLVDETNWQKKPTQPMTYGWSDQLADRILSDMDAEGMFD